MQDHLVHAPPVASARLSTYEEKDAVLCAKKGHFVKRLDARNAPECWAGYSERQMAYANIGEARMPSKPGAWALNEI